jgi:putative transcriptional regulator
MARAKSSILEGLEDAVAFAKGDKARGDERVVSMPAQVDVKAIRLRQDLSQSEFARRFGFPVASVQNWEQGRREPEGAARLLLSIIDREPRAVRRVLELCSLEYPLKKAVRVSRAANARRKASTTR